MSLPTSTVRKPFASAWCDLQAGEEVVSVASQSCPGVSFDSVRGSVWPVLGFQTVRARGERAPAKGNRPAAGLW